ncbi:hypothetical protein [Enterovibrio norvegicus]|uniref:hypothetical protein n=1 Tax=Enterovibrio norvegicus TaxID=188144 RepID=UPI00352D6DA2
MNTRDNVLEMPGDFVGMWNSERLGFQDCASASAIVWSSCPNERMNALENLRITNKSHWPEMEFSLTQNEQPSVNLNPLQLLDIADECDRYYALYQALNLLLKPKIFTEKDAIAVIVTHAIASISPDAPFSALVDLVYTLTLPPGTKDELVGCLEDIEETYSDHFTKALPRLTLSNLEVSIPAIDMHTELTTLAFLLLLPQLNHTPVSLVIRDDVNIEGIGSLLTSFNALLEMSDTFVRAQPSYAQVSLCVFDALVKALRNCNGAIWYITDKKPSGYLRNSVRTVFKQSKRLNDI